VAAWKNIVVSVAGAFGNVVFAFVLATVVWWVGKPSSLQERSAVVGYVATNSPALALGLVPGDELVAVDGQPVANWQQVVEKNGLGPGPRCRPALSLGCRGGGGAKSSSPPKRPPGRLDAAGHRRRGSVPRRVRLSEFRRRSRRLQPGDSSCASTAATSTAART
jgi:membrane-associated protease RseP (regulator of RpoE activity)